MDESATVRSMTEPLVYLLDGDRQVLQRLERLLADVGLTAVPSTTAASFFDSFRPNRVGCLVLDLALGDADGLAIQQEICDRGLTLPVVFLSGCATVPASVRAMKAGALDFLTKPVDFFALLTAVRAGIALDLVRRAEATEQRRLVGKLETLTTREKGLLPYLVSGMLNKQIAGELCVVEKTVKVHRAHVMAKLGVQSRSDLVRFAERLQISPITPRRLRAHSRLDSARLQPPLGAEHRDGTVAGDRSFIELTLGNEQS